MSVLTLQYRLLNHGAGDWPRIATEAASRIAELEAALTHAVEIAEDKRIGGTWDDLLPYRALLNSKKS